MTDGEATLSYNQKTVQLFDLLGQLIGPITNPVDKTHAILPVCACQVPEDQTTIITANPWVSFRPRRLIIFEVFAEREKKTTTEKWKTVRRRELRTKWWKLRRTEEHKELDERRVEVATVRDFIPRTMWEIGGLFVGNQHQFPSFQGELNGGTCAPESPPIFRDDVRPGMTISIQVRHSGKGMLPFRAVIEGEELADEKS